MPPHKRCDRNQLKRGIGLNADSYCIQGEHTDRIIPEAVREPGEWWAWLLSPVGPLRLPSPLCVHFNQCDCHSAGICQVLSRCRHRVGHWEFYTQRDNHKTLSLIVPNLSLVFSISLPSLTFFFSRAFVTTWHCNTSMFVSCSSPHLLRHKRHGQGGTWTASLHGPLTSRPH